MEEILGILAGLITVYISRLVVRSFADKMIRDLFSFTCVSSVAFLAYCALTASTFYYMLNPHALIDPQDTSTLRPLWSRGTQLYVTAYLSTTSKYVSQSSIQIWESKITQFDGATIRDSPPSKEFNFTKENLPAKFWARLEDNGSIYIHYQVRRVSKNVQKSSGPENEIWLTSNLVKWLDYVETPPKRYLVKDWPFLGAYVPQDVPIVEGIPASRPEETGLVGYWTPRAAVQIVEDWTHWPRLSTPPTVLRSLRLKGSRYLPVLYADKLGVTREKLVQINRTMSCSEHAVEARSLTVRNDGCVLPLRVSIESMSVAMWQFNEHMAQSIEAQKSFGASTKDMDEIRHTLTETSPILLVVTLVVSLLHAFIDFLAFKSDVTFWRKARSTVGLSVRSVLISLFNQVVIFFYLQDTGASLLILVPSGIGIIIQIWKVFQVLRIQEQTTKEASRAAAKTTSEYDEKATRLMLFGLLPIVAIYALYSLVFEKHASFYSWVISSLASCVYAFGFALMTPQLFINYKLKSVAHLPWQFLIYRAINTFIDDLFAFIIRMPTMHRLACFRDDVVFVIYMYQRWIYPVDKSRQDRFNEDAGASSSNKEKEE